MSPLTWMVVTVVGVLGLYYAFYRIVRWCARR